MKTNAKNRKRFALVSCIIVLSLLMATTITACQSASTTTPAPTTQATTAPGATTQATTAPAATTQATTAPKLQFVRIATAGTGGNYYRLGSAMMALMNDKFKGRYQYSIQGTKGTPHNIELINSKEVEIAFADSSVAIDAFNGTGNFVDKKGQFTNMGFLLCAYPNIYHFGVAKGAEDKIKSLYDIKGMRVSIGMIGSSAEAEMRNYILPALKLTYSDFQVENTIHAGTIDQLRNRQIDAAVWGDGVYSASWTEMAEAGLITFRSFPKEVIEAATKDRVTYPITIEPGTYPNQTEPFDTWGNPAIMMASLNTPEEVIYDFMKTMYDNNPYLVNIMPLARFMTVESALQGKGFGFHPGAEKYFREKGIIK